ncbi:YHS domain-containing protein [Roseomonas hellenica]|uniref:YHS domain-containing protein n=1 Tax=Plastoroseomonas hellenica TaxID=2687306 RepID=A0ABS5EWK0_9PROT|nr:YHS domain-containing (seleno)protein [Plastoroseomonas hellenica]MBR0664661.1 YHS domain-containing protein [Plastoroseomonas hellenica]
MSNRRKVLLGILAVPAAARQVKAAEPFPRPVNTLGSTDGSAIRGYDPVAYFASGGPQAGHREFALSHGGATWLFSSAGNRAAFEANPQRYLPAYNGFCAYGTSRGYLVKIEPEAWSIVDGRLYLNYSLGVRSTWLADPLRYIQTADMKWPQLSSADIRA